MSSGADPAAARRRDRRGDYQHDQQPQRLLQAADLTVIYVTLKEMGSRGVSDRWPVHAGGTGSAGAPRPNGQRSANSPTFLRATQHPDNDLYL